MEEIKHNLSSLKIDRSNPENNGSGSKKILKGIAYTALTIVLLVVLYNANKFFTKDEIEVESAVASLTSESQANAVLTANGYVVAQRKAAVASKGTGRLVFLGVVEGDKVAKGQIIARLEDNDIKAQLEQAKASLKVAEADVREAENSFKRTKALFATKSVTLAELEQAEARLMRVQANVDLAKAGVTAAEVALDNTLIRAPFSGTVLTKNADVGEIVAPFAASASSKAAVVTIADMTSLEVEADVSEANIQRIEPNQDCEISLDAYQESRYPAFVAKIVPTADRSKATVLVKIGFKKYDEKVLPEMSAKVIFLTKGDKPQVDTKPVLTVPSTAILVKDGKNVVFRIIGDELKSAEVVPGKNMGMYTEIKSGLVDGDKVVAAPKPEFKTGLKIKIK